MKKTFCDICDKPCPVANIGNTAVHWSAYLNRANWYLDLSLPAVPSIHTVRDICEHCVWSIIDANDKRVKEGQQIAIIALPPEIGQTYYTVGTYADGYNEAVAEIKRMNEDFRFVTGVPLGNGTSLPALASQVAEAPEYTPAPSAMSYGETEDAP